VVSGAVRVGEKSFIGVNATLRDNIEIGASSVIGAAAVVLKSTPERAVLKSQATEVAKITSDKLRGI